MCVTINGFEVWKHVNGGAADVALADNLHREFKETGRDLMWLRAVGDKWSN